MMIEQMDVTEQDQIWINVEESKLDMPFHSERSTQTDSVMIAKQSNPYHSTDLPPCTKRIAALKESESLYREVIDLRTNTLGPEHYDTLLAMHAVGYVLAELGKLPEAINMYERTLVLRERTLGRHHVDTLQTMDFLACMLSKMGRRAESVVLQRELIELKTNTLGRDHVETLTSMYNLAVVLSETTFT